MFVGFREGLKSTSKYSLLMRSGGHVIHWAKFFLGTFVKDPLLSNSFYTKGL